MALKSLVESYLDGIFKPLHTKGDFSRLITKMVIGNSPGNRLSDICSVEPVSFLYAYLSAHKNGWGRQRNSFESAVVSVLADPNQHRIEVSSGASLADVVWDGMRNVIAFHNSPNVANGRLAKQLMRKIDLEAIASGELRHANVQASMNGQANQSSPEYRAQRILTNLLFSMQQKDLPGRQYWEKIAGNPSFIEIRHHLAAAMRKQEEAKEMLPEVLKFYRQMLRGPYAISGFEKFVRSYSPIIGESVAFKRMEAAEKAFSKGSDAMSGLYRLAWPALTESNRGDTNRGESVLLLTSLKQTRNAVNVEYLRIDDSGIYRGLKASMELVLTNGRGTILPAIGEIPALIISRSDMEANPDIPVGEKRISLSTIKPRTHESTAVFMLTTKVMRLCEAYD